MGNHDIAAAPQGLAELRWHMAAVLDDCSTPSRDRIKSQLMRAASVGLRRAFRGQAGREDCLPGGLQIFSRRFWELPSRSPSSRGAPNAANVGYR